MNRFPILWEAVFDHIFNHNRVASTQRPWKQSFQKQRCRFCSEMFPMAASCYFDLFLQTIRSEVSATSYKNGYVRKLLADRRCKEIPEEFLPWDRDIFSFHISILPSERFINGLDAAPNEIGSNNERTDADDSGSL